MEGRELEFYLWEGEEKELLRSVREKLNAVGEVIKSSGGYPSFISIYIVLTHLCFSCISNLSQHWSRDEKNRCLREATKAFRYLAQIVRLIIL